MQVIRLLRDPQFANRLAVSSDGRMMAAAGNQEAPGAMQALTIGVRTWDATTLEKIETLSGFDVTDIQFSPDGRLLACAADKQIYVWNIPEGTGFSLTEEHTSVNAVAFSPSGETVAGAYSDGNVRLWDISTRNERRFRTHDPNVMCAFGYGALSVAYSPDGKLLATGGCDDMVHFWQPDTGDRTGVTLTLAAPAGIYHLAFTPDSSVLIIGAESTIEAWDVASGRRIAVLFDGPLGSHPIAVSPTGSKVAGVVHEYRDNTNAKIRVWDMRNVATGSSEHSLDVDGENLWPIRDLKFGGDDRTLFSAHGQEIRRWNLVAQ